LYWTLRRMLVHTEAIVIQLLKHSRLQFSLHCVLRPAARKHVPNSLSQFYHARRLIRLALGICPKLGTSCSTLVSFAFLLLPAPNSPLPVSARNLPRLPPDLRRSSRALLFPNCIQPLHPSRCLPLRPGPPRCSTHPPRSPRRTSFRHTTAGHPRGRLLLLLFPAHRVPHRPTVCLHAHEGVFYQPRDRHDGRRRDQYTGENSTGLASETEMAAVAPIQAFGCGFQLRGECSVPRE
jgi:hypothetical protein